MSLRLRVDAISNRLELIPSDARHNARQQLQKVLGGGNKSFTGVPVSNPEARPWHFRMGELLLERKSKAEIDSWR